MAAADIFALTGTLLPLALFVLLGWLIGRWKDIDPAPIATVLVYAVSPVVAFGSTAQIAFKGAFVALPAITGAIAAICAGASLLAGRRFLRDKDSAWLLPMTCGTGNNGYFGLPLALVLFPGDAAGIYFLIMLGATLFESTAGYYAVARGHLPLRQALARAVRLPMVYAIAGGMAFSALGATLPPAAVAATATARGCYVTLGMMLVGLALARHRRLSLPPDFLALTLGGKYILWAVLVAGFALLDTQALHLYTADIHAMMFILAITPVAANSVAYAAENRFRPELAATVVFVTTLLSCLLLPFALGWIAALRL